VDTERKFWISVPSKLSLLRSENKEG
jgi:hypothetical protein